MMVKVNHIKVSKVNTVQQYNGGRRLLYFNSYKTLREPLDSDPCIRNLVNLYNLHNHSHSIDLETEEANY